VCSAVLVRSDIDRQSAPGWGCTLTWWIAAGAGPSGGGVVLLVAVVLGGGALLSVRSLRSRGR
jgi:hypothetical protein